MDNVNVVLGGAIAIGVVLIIISILINIVTSLKKKEYDIAVFGNNGITGLVFFSAIMYAAVSMLIFEKNYADLCNISDCSSTCDYAFQRASWMSYEW